MAVPPTPTESFTHGDLTCVCVASLTEPLQTIYREHRWVYDCLASDGSATLRGRQPVLTGNVGPEDAVVKRLHHGGAAAALWKDRFVGAGRIAAHVATASYLQSRGIDTPDVLFASWRRNGFIARGEVGFRRVSGMDADQYFFARATPPADLHDRARSIGRLVRRLHQADFLHRDMNLMNFFFGNDGRIYLLDLDKARAGPKLTSSEMRRNLSRLERSVRKQSSRAGSAAAERILAAIREGYG